MAFFTTVRFQWGSSGSAFSGAAGLEFLFNDVCGNLQILNKYDPDPTALPYKDKLKLFLDAVLLKDEMHEKYPDRGYDKNANYVRNHFMKH